MKTLYEQLPYDVIWECPKCQKKNKQGIELPGGFIQKCTATEKCSGVHVVTVEEMPLKRIESFLNNTQASKVMQRLEEKNLENEIIKRYIIQ